MPCYPVLQRLGPGLLPGSPLGMRVQPALKGRSDLGLSSCPGSPSGHAMGAAGVYYVMVTALLSAAMGKKQLRTLKYW